MWWFFIVATFIMAIGMAYSHENGTVYVLCKEIYIEGQSVHVISGIFTSKLKALKHFTDLHMYVLKIKLNDFTQLDEEVLSNLISQNESDKQKELNIKLNNKKETK